MTAPTWTQQELSLPPVRGLIPLHNRKGLPYRFVDLQRWIRLTRLYQKSQKIDLLHLGNFRPDFPEILSASNSAGLDVALSIRTDCGAPPPPPLAEWNLLDVFLCPPGRNSAHFDAWLRVCREAEIPVRLQLPMGAAAENAPDALAAQFAEYGVRSVFFALADPFTALPRQHLGASTVHWLLQAADALEARQIETHFLHVPFCQVPPERFPNITNTAQYFRSPQCYTALSYRLAEQVYRRHPAIAARIIQVRLGEFMSYDNPLDRGIQKWLLESHQRMYEKVLAGRKLLRYVPRERPGTVLETEEALDAAVSAARHARDEQMHKECRRCRLRYICDRDTAVFRHSFPSARLEAQEGELCLSPAQFARQQWVCLDPIDAARRDSARSREALAENARRVMGSVPPDRQFNAKNDYSALNAHHFQLPGAVRWFALTPDEKRSSELGAFRAPFTLAATFGGGIAEQIGFAVGRYMRVVCPMEAFSHRLALHVDAAGNYALLRDNALVAPTEFDGPHYPPLRLPTFVKPQLSLWNIDGSIFTQNILLWEGEHAPPGPQTQPKYSIIIVSIRFTRRLQAVLRSLVHQRDFDPARLEIIIAYITGMDATDDLISSFELAYPGLRIVRSPFPERYAKSKGFVINESIGLTRGAWVMILDSDILLPPDFLHRLDTLPGSPPFVAPDRRKMLTPESTARILIGEIAPWEHWDELLEGPGELRVQEARLPIGFCQCVRRDCFDTVRYLEYDHFAGADWDFIVEVEQKFGEGKWLENVAVLHLDHGGSQWYGVQKHL